MSKPIAWMRKWAFDGETPVKVKGRWPTKYRFLPVTVHKVHHDDVPLIAQQAQGGNHG